MTGDEKRERRGNWEMPKASTLKLPSTLCLDSLSCRFFIRGEPPNKNAAKPSGNKGVRESLPSTLYPLNKTSIPFQSSIDLAH
jgi:hypothetical protein